MSHRAREVLVEALRDLRRSWRALILTDLSFKLVAFAALSPITLLLLRWAMSEAGAEVVTDVDIAMFFLASPQGLVALLLGSAIVVAISAIELACVSAIGLAVANGRHPRVWAALAFGAARAVPVLRLAMNIVARLVVGLIPFALVIGLASWVLLGDHDINYYLARRPAEFWTAVAIAAVVVAALVVVVVRTVGRWALALPLVLFEEVSPRRALAEATSRSADHRVLIIAALLAWTAMSLALVSAAAFLPEIVGRAAAPFFGGSFETILVFITGLLILLTGLGLAATTVNMVLLALVLLRLYLNVGRPQISRMPAMGMADGTHSPRLPAAARVVVAIAAVLAAAGFAIVAMSVASRSQPVLVIAHRGASAAAPENTLAAFRLGAELGADFVELDVQESADGEVVVIHDSDLMKVGGSPLKIWEATAAELRTVDIGSHKGAPFSAERVPTLAEALAVCKGRVRVVVELKTYGHGQRLEERVVEIVEAAGMEAETIFMSLDHDMARKLKQLRPTWRVGVLVAKALGDLTSIDTDFLAVEAGLATRGFLRQAHRAGMDVYIWTVNDPALMVSTLSQGVDGLITDRPDLARQVIGRRSRMSDEQRIMVALLVRLGVRADALAAAAIQ